jgi:hypothetical protein
MNDLTLLYYTANRIDLRFQVAVAAELFRVSLEAHPPRGLPIRAVSQRELPFFGDDWIEEVVGPIGASIYNVYKQILAGAKMATTPYVACCEDDTLYVPEHFTYRPPLDTFAYNENRLVITRRLSADGRRREAIYYFRPRTQMAQCIAPRQLLIDTLEEKFAKYPTPPASTTIAKKAGWGEPGRYEKNLGLSPRNLLRFKWTKRPNVTFNHSESLMGRRALRPDDQIFETAEPWGSADALWERIHG